MPLTIANVDFTVDEHIWGHRLYDEQLPHLTVLEFLGVLGANWDTPLANDPAIDVYYTPQQQFRLRGLLFNNPYVEAVRDREVPDEDKWRDWMELFKQDATGRDDLDMEYLRKSFLSFDDFAKALELLRSSSFEARSNKRWSSKFVFPFGPDALYEDLRIDSGGASNDRRFFARTGELLYLMLSRASNGAELGKKLVERLFNANAPMNRLVKALQGAVQTAGQPKTIGQRYLPYAKHPRFDRMCDDWLAILSRDIPIYDALEHLIASAGLNLILYYLECAKKYSGDDEPVEMVCEIISRERTKVRSLSGKSYQTHQAVSERAIVSFIESIKLKPEWTTALESADPEGECVKLMREIFQWPPVGRDDEDDYERKRGDELVSDLIEKAKGRHDQHLAKIHATWSKAIGLSSRRLARGNRYAPNDHLLKTLVVTVVDERMQFDEFLHELRRRYGIVIGDAEGAHLVKQNQIDQEALSENRSNLEARLLGLGLVRRLSDSCSFVENPFASEGDH
jgi:hypothetical protein